MGSSGSGSFTDYPGSSKGKTSDGGGSSGTPPPSDPCLKAFSAALEDVEQCDYFKNHGQVPSVGTQLTVTLKKRLVAQTANGEVVGNLPTTLNYLAGCLKSGHNYVGNVRSSGNGPPAAFVNADFAPV
jgi:hypothetical protein